MFILAGAQALSAYLTWERIPMMISEAIINGIHSPYLFLLIVNILLLAISLVFLLLEMGLVLSVSSLVK